MSVNRTLILIIAVAVLLAGNFIYRAYANWGLITVRVKDAPLQKVIRTIERQGNVNVETDLENNTKVTMHVVKVPLAEALDTLAGVTDAQWRLNFVLAPDKRTLRDGLATIQSGQSSDAWKTVHYRMPRFFEVEGHALPDPREDLWKPSLSEAAPLQTLIDDAAKSANAAFTLPIAWNPTVKPPKEDELTDNVPKLAKAAGGKAQEVFLLAKMQRSEPGDPPPQRPQWADGPDRFTGFAQRAQQQIKRLPPKERAEAEAQLQQMQSFWEEVRNLPPEQRREKMRERMSDPKIQAQWEERDALRDTRRTPQQRLQRYQRYVERKRQQQQ
jgi:hypothetical protein